MNGEGMPYSPFISVALMSVPRSCRAAVAVAVDSEALQWIEGPKHRVDRIGKNHTSTYYFPSAREAIRMH